MTTMSFFKTTVRAFLTGSLLAVAAGGAIGSSGCVSSRDARNGVFNENQYLRKEFLIRPGDGSKSDPGWMLKASIVSTSTPNPLGSGVFFVVPGLENGGALVRFRVTSDKLQ